MTITFSGDEFTSTQRVLTQCHSLDWALGDRLGNVGWPLKSLIEVYGPKNVGKSTFTFSLMGILAKHLQKNITILDWEGQSRETVEGVLDNQKFVGNVNYVLNVGDESSEDTLERFVEEIMSDKQNVALIDSLGGFRPTALMEGRIGDANMGVFARETGQFTNKLIYAILRSKSPGSIFMTNHVHPTIGSMVQGQTTSGGEKKKYLAHVRIDLKRAFLKNKDGKEGGTTVDFGESWLLKGHIDSSRFGYSKRDFYVYMIGGEGIHIGLTAMWDCILLDYAQVSAKKIALSTTVSMDGQSFGKLGKMIKERNNAELFVPFINRLRQDNNDTESIEKEEVVEEPKKKRGKK